ncbi:MAG: DNA polymerase III subunit gamma/tau [Patescibacteria group bacterium]
MPSLSQRYRPRRFSEVTGQRHATETLRKEVETGVLGHAYLFCGPRGVGKTTAARIFAKALTCEAPVQGEPCDTCASCLATNAGKQMDIIEMDAATHTGVDNVRESIIEHVRFGPSVSKRKVYILDEAHSLSGPSWNALLKTLEEPPAYAYFILATTEWHKVPVTIVSRCQRFEFRRITDADLFARVKEMAQKEGWTIEDDVASLIVSRADGCVRDAETLLGQIGSLGENHLTMDIAGLVIPASHRGVAVGLLALWADHKHAEALQEVQRLFDEGVPVQPLMEDLLASIRRLLIASSDPKHAEAWKQGMEDDRRLAELVGKFSPLELNDLALLIFERRRDIKAGVDPLFALQLASTVAACGLTRHAECQGMPPLSRPVESAPRSEQREEPPSVPRETLPVVQENKQAPIESTHEKPVAISVPAPVTTPVVSQGTLEIGTVRAKWNLFVSAVEEKNHSLPFILKISRPERVEGDRIVVRFQYAFHRDKILSDVKHLRIVEECAREIFACPTCRFEGMVGEDPAQQEQRSTDMVGNILKAFGGQVVE